MLISNQDMDFEMMKYHYTLSIKTNIKQTDKGYKVSIKQDEKILQICCTDYSAYTD